MLPIVKSQRPLPWNKGKAGLHERAGLKEKAELMEDVRRAKRELEIAQRHFHDALGQDQVDYAIYVLEAAEKRLDMLLRRAKQVWSQENQKTAGEGEAK